MLELVDAMTTPFNWPWTFLMAMVILFWASAILGAVDIESLDMDLDGDIDVDVDADIDVDADVDVDADIDAGVDAGTMIDHGHGGHHGATGWLSGLLSFLNMGKVPFTIVVSAFSLCAWIGGLMAHRYLPWTTEWTGLIWYAPLILCAGLGAKWATAPLAPLFSKLNESGGLKSAIGQLGHLKSEAGPQRLGQALITIQDADILINVRTHGDILNKGDQVFILERAQDQDFYYVERI